MISLLKGALAQKNTNEITLDVGGVGYRVFIPVSTYSKLANIGEETTLNIHTHVREDQISLFGFLTTQERSMFLKLITISGVGPKLALAILSGIQTTDLINAIANAEAEKLQLIPGVGKKTSERIVVELKDKVKAETIHTKGPHNEIYDDALSAMLNLGFVKPKVVNALNKIEINKETKLEDIIKMAFKELK